MCRHASIKVVEPHRPVRPGLSRCRPLKLHHSGWTRFALPSEKRPINDNDIVAFKLYIRVFPGNDTFVVYVDLDRLTSSIDAFDENLARRTVRHATGTCERREDSYTFRALEFESAGSSNLTQAKNRDTHRAGMLMRSFAMIGMFTLGLPRTMSSVTSMVI